MKLAKTIVSASLVGLTFSCGDHPHAHQEDAKTHEEMHKDGIDHEHEEELSIEFNEIEIQKEGIKVYSANIAKAFPDAVLKMKTPQVDGTLPGKQLFEFEVENYELARQTEGAEERHCANSQKGQHIHFIVNNGPYAAHYESSFEAELLEGNNVVLAFLSRSYHESIKNGTAHVLKTFQIGDQPSTFDHDAAHLFYSRPKGSYQGEDSKKILLDFFLLNTELAENGNKVKVLIDDVDFELPSWQPYFVEGLEKGKHTFRIQLIDKSGDFIEGPFNDSGLREIEIL